MTAILWIVLCILQALNVSALWPFGQKRFDAETLIDAGPLGLEGVTGRVVALGDWNGDQNIDLLVLSESKKELEIHLWNRDTFRYTLSHTLTLSSEIFNVVPGDYNHDGRLDVLVMYDSDDGWWGGSKDRIGMQVFFGGADGGFQEEKWSLPDSTGVQGTIFDGDGSLRPSLLAFEPNQAGSLEGVMRVWHNNGTGFQVREPPLIDPDKVCSIASPHSSAFVDIDGDCLPDLVLQCTRPRSSHHSIQIWLNRGPAGFELARTYDLPKGSGPLSFADMNRDGAIDIVFPTCGRRSSSSGIGYECALNIAYSQQVATCGTEYSQMGPSGMLKCRGWGQLCQADEHFEFSFESGDEHFSSIPFATLFPSEFGSHDLLLHPANQPLIPLPIRAGDYNADGFPDLLFTISNSTATPSSGPFGGGKRGSQVRILENVPCKKGVAGCEEGGQRGFRLASGKGYEVLDGLWDVQGASWVDVDDDGSLDILLQRSGAQGGGRATFIQNNIYHDAFFLKAQMLNGACDGPCQPVDGGKKYTGSGVSFSGATYKFSVLDTLGRRGAQQVAQLPQTGYHALGTPYSFVGLGRTNNYIERLSVGASLYPPLHTTDLESIIPNSQLIINPPSPVTNESQAPPAPVRARSAGWRSELFLHPGDWVPWVGAAVVATVLILSGVVLLLHEREKKEDEKERRRALHAINFQAL